MMFEKLEERARRHAEAAAANRRDAIATELARQAPRGVRVETTAAGVTLSGYRLARRFALEPALRALLARVR